MVGRLLTVAVSHGRYRHMAPVHEGRVWLTLCGRRASPTKTRWHLTRYGTVRLRDCSNCADKIGQVPHLPTPLSIATEERTR